VITRCRIATLGGQIRASYTRTQKTDKRDAVHILKLLADAQMRDQRQLLIHRHKLVQIRTRVKNERQHLMMNPSVQKQYKLWSVRGRAELEQPPLQHWAGQRREDLLCLLEDAGQTDRVHGRSRSRCSATERSGTVVDEPSLALGP
jgi:transposase